MVSDERAARPRAAPPGPGLAGATGTGVISYPPRALGLARLAAAPYASHNRSGKDLVKQAEEENHDRPIPPNPLIKIPVSVDRRTIARRYDGR